MISHDINRRRPGNGARAGGSRFRFGGATSKSLPRLGGSGDVSDPAATVAGAGLFRDDCPLTGCCGLSSGGVLGVCEQVLCFLESSIGPPDESMHRLKLYEELAQGRDVIVI